MEFHISRHLRDRLDLDDTLFRYTGDVVFGNVAAARKLALRWSRLREQDTDAAGATAETAVNAGALFAMGLIDELNHALIAEYRKTVDPDVLAGALQWFAGKTSAAAVETLLTGFTTDFPNVAVYRGKLTPAEWLTGSEEGLPNREAAFEELLLLWLANRNPAFAPFRELFADTTLRQGTAYGTVAETMPDYFETRPLLDPAIGTLLDALEAPMLASPDSITGQLDFIRQKWAPQLGAELKRVLLAVDVLREEDLAIWMRFNPPAPDRYQHGAPGFGGEGFVGDEYVGFDEAFQEEYVVGADGVRQRKYAADYQAPLNEYEAFSADQAWMPNVVMMAKSTYVWLEQLSQKYGRHIHRLDQIPDEELDLLSNRGITALWLIGLWERSTASRTIKRLRGHADAVASAYSLKEYKIAEDLGGNEGYESLRDRAARFGIRLASDMVPNHMGIDSDWVIEHPEWFLSRWESPFPVYSFNGPDLSSDSRVEIKIEDHYYDQTDAAVAFRVRDHASGATRFMYHGNDGTTFAWNDTAQLDYSKAAVREHVIQVILYVARLFPIIRFDAAMVLAKRHVQRLWFPLPGAGGSIPSRAEDAMSQEEFEALMPLEFWREVVDRVAVEVPGTLLLAEAFWLLESYFVRTLGMHRVYNSAFMNMLRDEENAKYRSYLKKTVEFDTDILKRYVNFMSNPDERTAIDQFGSGDKFFGCCTLLATLPGLPMFGHGQIEGFTERYGMEYKQAKMKESPNEGLVARHQHEIAPLLKRRAIFAESENFLLYDFWTESGEVDENVFAYSNRKDGQRSVIVYNNAYSSTSGTIHLSAASVEKSTGQLRQRSLAEGLALPGEGDWVLAYRDTTSGLEYLRRVSQLQGEGLRVALRGYQYFVLLDWRELQSTAQHPWSQLADALQGGGVYSVEDALSKLRTRPLVEAMRAALGSEELSKFAELSLERVEEVPEEPLAATDLDTDLDIDLDTLPDAPAVALVPADDPRTEPFLRKSGYFFDRLLELVEPGDWVVETDGTVAGDRVTPAERYRLRLREMTDAALDLDKLAGNYGEEWPESLPSMLPSGEASAQPHLVWAPILGWLTFAAAAEQVQVAQVFDRLHLRAAMAEVFLALGMEGDAAWRAAARVRLLLNSEELDPLSATFWQDADVRWLTNVHDAHGVSYFDKPGFEGLVAWIQLPKLLTVDAATLTTVEEAVSDSLTAAAVSGYSLDALLAKPPAASSSTLEMDESEMENAKVREVPVEEERLDYPVGDDAETPAGTAAKI